jgi:ABC-type transport system involved in multi-copper enzyme maturation permease subunit
MMTQTAALFLDAYRELNAKKLFWTVLALNVLVMAGFATLGVRDNSLTFLWYDPTRGMLGASQYKFFYNMLVVNLWFTWLATILALISTAGIFPDLMASGSIDLYLSKPIGRLRLFFTKYLTGLLFVSMQVSIFALASFLVLGWRGGIWEPGIFWAIPLFLLFFSYLFGICVLIGVLTRSAIAALLITLLIWVSISVVSFVDSQAGTVTYILNVQYTAYDRQIALLDQRIADARPTDDLSRGELASLRKRRDELAADRDKAIPPEGLKTAQTVLYYIQSFLPKTRDTLNLLNRSLYKDEELKAAISPDGEDALPLVSPPGQPRQPGQRNAGGGGRAVREALNAAGLAADREKSILWIIGTSLIFEAVTIALAAWRFCTRDY